jgi:hypothetical protein
MRRAQGLMRRCKVGELAWTTRLASFEAGTKIFAKLLFSTSQSHYFRQNLPSLLIENFRCREILLKNSLLALV